MKICICTTPIRPVPTTYPPMGSMAIIQSLRKIDEHATFFNIDYFRPDKEAVRRHFEENQYDIVGISAVVSTAYAYTKFLGNLIREVSPKTVIILGGNLAASAEILLRKCNIDICVSGDGEIVMRELVQAIRDGKNNIEHLKTIKGIAFLDENKDFKFTGYGPRPAADEIEFPDYDILEGPGAIDHFLPEMLDDRFTAIADAARPEGRMATLPTTKGCVSRCTFCHRWEKGYRVLPLNNISDHLDLLEKRFGVKYIDIADENFGSDKAASKEFAEEMGRRGMVWRAGGVRASTVNPELLAHWKQHGCGTVIYGMESGSQTMLDIMEKKISVEQNFNAVKWTYEAGLFTVVQLIIGMPGETDRTIRESIEFLKRTSEYLYLNGDLPSSLLSLNYAQALPGTPLYEYARENGFIGLDLDEEEKYLLKISDTDAYKSDHFINYTGLPLIKVLAWQQQILAELDSDYIRKKFGARYSVLQVIKFYLQLVLSRLSPRLAKLLPAEPLIPAAGATVKDDSYKKSSGYFNIRAAGKFTPILLNPITRVFFKPLVILGVAFGKSKDSRTALALMAEYLMWHLKAPFRGDLEAKLPKKTLRKVIKIVPSTGSAVSHENMVPLRSGR